MRERTMRTDTTERDIYAQIAAGSGVKAREIGRALGLDHTTVNRVLYGSPYIRELCYKDGEDRWHGLIRQARPHRGLGDYCGWYGTAGELCAASEEAWFEAMLAGCESIGRNLNDTRGLFHSFRDTFQTMRRLFEDLAGTGLPAEAFADWEVCFELRIKRGRYIRIYADVLVITERYVFSLEFKMKDQILPDEVSQAAKYQPYLETLFGPGYDVISALVLTQAQDLYVQADLPGTSAIVPVCSGDMLFNLFNEYLGFLD